MKHIKTLTLILCMCSIWVSGSAIAATHYATPQYAILMTVDKKHKTVIIRNEIYKLRRGVKIHDGSNKFPNLSSLPVGNEIIFKTRKNKRTGQVEISEIWIQGI